MGFFAVLVLVIVGGVFYVAYIQAQNEKEKRAAMSPAELAVYLFGERSEHLICPHCQARGPVRAKQAMRTTTSTGKIGGILKTNTKSQTTVAVTQHHCDQCGTTWDV